MVPYAPNKQKTAHRLPEVKAGRLEFLSEQMTPHYLAPEKKSDFFLSFTLPSKNVITWNKDPLNVFLYQLVK